MTFERIVKFSPAYNAIAEGRGRHCVEVAFVLKGDGRAVQFVLYTGWLISGDRDDAFRRGGIVCPDGLRRHDCAQPLPADLGYHSPVAMYEGQSVIEQSCRYTGGICYYDGSGLNAADAFDVLTDEGEEALWKLLEEYYRATFEGASFPDAIGRRWNRERARR